MTLPTEKEDEIRRSVKNKARDLLTRGAIPSVIVEDLKYEFCEPPNGYIDKRTLTRWVKEAAMGLAATNKKIQRDRAQNLGLAILWQGQVVAAALARGNINGANSAIKQYAILTGNGELFDSKGGGMNFNILNQAGGVPSIAVSEQYKNLTDEQLRVADTGYLPAILDVSQAEHLLEGNDYDGS